MPPLSIMIKPASSRCNLRCAYCFYADEAQNRAVPDCGLMGPEVSRALMEKASCAAEGSISFLFQGGEPTLAGLAFYREFVRYEKETISRGLPVHYAIQTNGTLLDDEWCDFFAQNHFLVGLSIDGTRACHDRFRRDNAGKGTYRQTLRGAELLKKHKVDFNVLTVVTGPLAEQIDTVFPAFCKNGFGYQQYIPCLDPIGERGGQAYSLSPQQYGLFLKKLFDLWYGALAGGRYYSVRYFDNLVWMLLGRGPEQCSMAGRCGIQYLIEADGSVYPCDFYGLDEYRLGNVLTDDWETFDRERDRLGFVKESLRIPDACRQCRWHPLCRNGCRRDREATQDGLGRNYYCEAYRTFFPYAIGRLEQVANWMRWRGTATGRR